MTIQNWSEDAIVVDLPQEPAMFDELKTVTEIVCNKGGCDVIIDFSSVDIVTSLSISELLKLRKLLPENCHRIILCSVAPLTKSIFTEVGLEGIFEFINDRSIALKPYLPV